MVRTWERYFETLSGIDTARVSGRVRRVSGLIAECEGLSAPVGAVCAIRPAAGAALRAEVVGFREEATLLMPFGEVTGVRRGDEALRLGKAAFVIPHRQEQQRRLRRLVVERPGDAVISVLRGPAQAALLQARAAVSRVHRAPVPPRARSA